MALLAVGYACGNGGASAALDAAMTLFEFNGASLAGQLAKAGAPPITSPFGIAELVPEDGTRHFTHVGALRQPTEKGVHRSYHPGAASLGNRW